MQFDSNQIAPRVEQLGLIQFQISDISHLSPYGDGEGGTGLTDRCRILTHDIPVPNSLRNMMVL